MSKESWRGGGKPCWGFCGSRFAMSLGCPRVQLGREGRWADPELLDGPTSSWVLPEIVYRSGNCIHDSPETSYVFVFLFPSRGENDEGGAEPFSPESPGGSQLYSEVQFFCHNEDSAVVPAESRRQPHQSVFHSFRDEAEWKTEFHSEF